MTLKNRCLSNFNSEQANILLATVFNERNIAGCSANWTNTSLVTDRLLIIVVVMMVNDYGFLIIVVIVVLWGYIAHSRLVVRGIVRIELICSVVDCFLLCCFFHDCFSFLFYKDIPWLYIGYIFEQINFYVKFFSDLFSRG